MHDHNHFQKMKVHEPTQLNKCEENVLAERDRERILSEHWITFYFYEHIVKELEEIRSLHSPANLKIKVASDRYSNSSHLVSSHL